MMTTARLRLSETEAAYEAAAQEKPDPDHIRQACKMSHLGGLRAKAEDELMRHYRDALEMEGRATVERLKFISSVREFQISGPERRSVIADARQHRTP